MIDVEQIDLSKVPKLQVVAHTEEIKAAVKQGMQALVDLSLSVLSDQNFDLNTKAAFLMLASRMGNPYPAPPATSALYGRKMMEAAETLAPPVKEIWDALRPGIATSITRQMFSTTIGQCHMIAEGFGTEFHLFSQPEDAEGHSNLQPPPTFH